MEEQKKDLIPKFCYESVGRLYLQLSQYEEIVNNQHRTISSLNSEVERLQEMINSGNFGASTKSKKDPEKDESSS